MRYCTAMLLTNAWFLLLFILFFIYKLIYLSVCMGLLIT